MTDYYVYSTLSSSVVYTKWIKGHADLPILQQKVLINGGAGVVDKKHLMTPRGIVTKITEEQMAILEQDEVFKAHVKNGFIKVEAKEYEPEVVVADMIGRDLSAPIVPEDYNEEDAAQPVETEKKGRGRPKK